MGKQKHNFSSKKSSKGNVFKIVGARSLKLKNKAKAVSTQLKKLNEVTRNKTAEIDQLLTSDMQAQLLQKQKQKTSDMQAQLLQKQKQNQSSMGHSEPQDKVMKNSENVNKVSLEAMNKLCEMKM